MKKIFYLIRAAYRRLLSALILKLGAESYSFYLGSPQSLPPPLSAEEEAALLEDFYKRREEVCDKLIVHNLRLVVYIAKKFDAVGASTEDLISIGAIGLIKAVRTFAPEKNIKLATYASRCIENEILMYLRKASSLKAEVSIDEPLNVDWDGNELMLSDILGSEPDEVGRGLEVEDERSLLIRLVGQLPPRDREIITLRFGLRGGREYTQKEVADWLGISQSYISRLEKRIIEKLKKDLDLAAG